MTNAEARFNNSLRPRKPEGSLGRTAQDVHLDSHTATLTPPFHLCPLIHEDLLTRGSTDWEEYSAYTGWKGGGGGGEGGEGAGRGGMRRGRGGEAVTNATLSPPE